MNDTVYKTCKLVIKLLKNNFAMHQIKMTSMAVPNLWIQLNLNPESSPNKGIKHNKEGKLSPNQQTNQNHLIYQYVVE